MPASTPTPNMLMTSDVPPYEMNGSGTPVTGHADVTTPMFTSACTTIDAVSPIAR